MVRIIQLAVLCALLSATLPGCSTTHSDGQPGPGASLTSAPHPAYTMPPISIPSRTRTGANQYGFTSLDNRRMSLSDYLGQVVVVDFYATWCPPCREETPHLVEMQRRYGSQGLHIIGLNVGGPGDRDKVPGFVHEFGIPREYTLGFPDPEMAALCLSDDDSIPQAFVFDKKGHLLKRFVSYDSSMPAELEQILKSALSSPAG